MVIRIEIESSVNKMGMTNRQFQGWLRTIIKLITKMLKINPDNEELKELLDLFQSMVEDETD